MKMTQVVGAKLSRWTLAYFTASLAALLAAEALVAGGLAYPAAPLFAPGSLVAVHVVTIGWLSLLMLGALHQFLPVIAARPLASDRLALASLVLIETGLAAMIAGFLALGGIGAVVALLPLGGVSVLAGFLCAVANLGWTLRGVSPLPLPARFIVAALGFLLLTALLGIGFGCAFVLPTPPRWLAALAAEGLALHLLAGIGGWFALTAVGVSYKLLPMFMLAEEDRGRVGAVILWLTAGGLAAAWSAGVLAIIADPRWRLVAMTGEVAFAAGLGLYLWDMRRLYRSRHRRRLELNSLAAAASMVPLALALVGGVAMRFAPNGTDWAAPLVLLTLLGWLSLLGLSQLYKIVPFLTWLERYASRLGRGPVPRVQDLVNEARAWPWFALFALGTLVSTAAAALAAPDVARLGAVLLFVSTLAIVRELLRARRVSPARASPGDLSKPLQHRESFR
ncbi:MAG TPA: hypothetical protein VET85_00875 [Stellaceae bacterium]|nr:hypothetical protein [Stellaceae bacterium]